MRLECPHVEEKRFVWPVREVIVEESTYFRDQGRGAVFVRFHEIGVTKFTGVARRHMLESEECGSVPAIAENGRQVLARVVEAKPAMRQVDQS